MTGAAYSNEQMLAAVVNAALAWTERLAAADREQAKNSETTKTAILVLDFDELVELRDALGQYGMGARTPIGEVLHDELDKWVANSEPIETPEGTS